MRVQILENMWNDLGVSGGQGRMGNGKLIEFRGSSVRKA